MADAPTRGAARALKFAPKNFLRRSSAEREAFERAEAARRDAEADSSRLGASTSKGASSTGRGSTSRGGTSRGASSSRGGSSRGGRRAAAEPGARREAPEGSGSGAHGTGRRTRGGLRVSEASRMDGEEGVLSGPSAPAEVVEGRGRGGRGRAGRRSNARARVEDEDDEDDDDDGDGDDEAGDDAGGKKGAGKKAASAKAGGTKTAGKTSGKKATGKKAAGTKSSKELEDDPEGFDSDYGASSPRLEPLSVDDPAFALPDDDSSWDAVLNDASYRETEGQESTAPRSSRRAPAEDASRALQPIRLPRHEHVDRQVGINTQASSAKAAHIRRQHQQGEVAGAGAVKTEAADGDGDVAMLDAITVDGSSRGVSEMPKVDAKDDDARVEADDAFEDEQVAFEAEIEAGKRERMLQLFGPVHGEPRPGWNAKELAENVFLFQFPPFMPHLHPPGAEAGQEQTEGGRARAKGKGKETPTETGRAPRGGTGPKGKTPAKGKGKGKTSASANVVEVESSSASEVESEADELGASREELRQRGGNLRNGPVRDGSEAEVGGQDGKEGTGKRGHEAEGRTGQGSSAEDPAEAEEDHQTKRGGRVGTLRVFANGHSTLDWGGVQFAVGVGCKGDWPCKIVLADRRSSEELDQETRLDGEQMQGVERQSENGGESAYAMGSVAEKFVVSYEFGNG